MLAHAIQTGEQGLSVDAQHIQFPDDLLLGAYRNDVLIQKVIAGISGAQIAGLFGQLHVILMIHHLLEGAHIIAPDHEPAGLCRHSAIKQIGRIQERQPQRAYLTSAALTLGQTDEGADSLPPCALVLDKGVSRIQLLDIAVVIEPIEHPHHRVFLLAVVLTGKIQRHQRILRPVQKAGRHAVMLRQLHPPDVTFVPVLGHISRRLLPEMLEDPLFGRKGQILVCACLPALIGRADLPEDAGQQGPAFVSHAAIEEFAGHRVVQAAILGVSLVQLADDFQILRNTSDLFFHKIASLVWDKLSLTTEQKVVKQALCYPSITIFRLSFFPLSSMVSMYRLTKPSCFRQRAMPSAKSSSRMG